MRRPVLSKGGQLQVAGVVVGSWGANYGYQGVNNQPTSSISFGRGRGVNQYPQNSRGRGQGKKTAAPSYPVGNRKQSVSIFFI